MITKIVKWISLPALLIGSIFSQSAARYELWLDVVICLGAMVAVQQEVRRKEYFWAAGFVAIVIVFSPVIFMTKIFLLMGLTCAATFGTLLVACKPRPAPAA